MSSEYVFGPVPSRRFGRSLGVNPLPRKTCNYSCVYCQLGRTPKLQAEPAEHYPTGEVVAEVRRAVAEHTDSIDYVTFMGDGEPTLASNLGDMVQGVKMDWAGRTALITNGSLLHRPEVRRTAALFDVVSPTVSAGDERTFRQLHRPHRSLNLKLVLDGMRRFREEYRGEIWAEVMLVAGVNDSIESLLKIRSVLREVGPDRVFVNAPIRPPAESWVCPPSKASMRKVFDIIPEAEDMTGPESGPFIVNDQELMRDLVMIASNHPLREDQALQTLSEKMGMVMARETLRYMIESGMLEAVLHSGTTFFRAPSRPG